MQLIITGKAPIGTLKNLKIIPEGIQLPDDQITTFGTHLFASRTSSGERDLLEILGFDENRLETYSINQDDLTEDKLEEIKNILRVSGEESDADDIAELQQANATFSGFIALFH